MKILGRVESWQGQQVSLDSMLNNQMWIFRTMNTTFTKQKVAQTILSTNIDQADEDLIILQVRIRYTILFGFGSHFWQIVKNIQIQFWLALYFLFHMARFIFIMFCDVSMSIFQWTSAILLINGLKCFHGLERFLK